MSIVVLLCLAVTAVVKQAVGRKSGSGRDCLPQAGPVQRELVQAIICSGVVVQCFSFLHGVCPCPPDLQTSLINGPVLIYGPLQLDTACCTRERMVQSLSFVHTAGTTGGDSAAADDVGASSSAKFVT